MADIDAIARIRDTNREENPRKRCPSDNPASQQIRNKKRKQTTSKNRGKLDFYYENDADKTELFNKMDDVKMFILGEGKVSKTSTYTALHHVLDFYLQNNAAGGPRPVDDAINVTPTYQYSAMDVAEEDALFVCTQSAIDNLVARISEHTALCKGKLKILKFDKIRHVGTLQIRCNTGHTIDWVSSPHVEGGKFLVNIKMAHGYFASGMLPNQYDRLCVGAGMGRIGDKYLSDLQSQYQIVVEEETNLSEQSALFEETALSVASGQDDGISIMTDARHCWRRNAKFTDVACLGDLSHKVLRVETVSKEDDSCSQRHELIGVKRVYAYLEKEQCPVINHAHDNNASVGKYVAEMTEATNCLDTWHVAKNIAKGTKKITTGTKKMTGILWHPE
jgi:hypothetical protein